MLHERRRILISCNKMLESSRNRTPALDFCSAIFTSNEVAPWISLVL